MRLTMANYKAYLGESRWPEFLAMVEGLQRRNQNLEIWLISGKLTTRSPYEPE
jgi:hypothetical protein